jgi:histidine triad (HIT) family protein
MPTLFERIIAREIPAKIVYETDDVLAFHDIGPQAPTHILVVPKKAIPGLSSAKDLDGEVLGRLLLAARDIAMREGLEGGYRVVINDGPDGGQSVDHLHVHLLGGRKLAWPPG